MADRYFIETPADGPLVRLSGAEAHHLLHVMRARPGDEVTLFDGSGVEFSARVQTVGRAEIEFEILSRHEVDRELRVQVTLGVALPKGDRQRVLVEKAVELGIARLVPLLTERGTQRESAGAIDRLRRAVIEASKQCGRNRLMEIAEPARLEKYLGSMPDAQRFFAHPGAARFNSVLEPSIGGHELTTSISLAVGPEGGFNEAEIEQAKTAGWQPVGLGSRILRVETAAITLAAAVMLWVEE